MIDPAEDANHCTLVIGGTETLSRGEVSGKRLAVAVTGRSESRSVDEFSIAAKEDSDRYGRA